MVPEAECFSPAWRCLPSQSLLGLTPAPTTAAEYDTMTHLHPPLASRNLSSNRFPPCTPHSRPYQRDPLSPLGDYQLFEVSSVCLHWALHRVDVPLCPTVFAFKDLERALRSFIRGRSLACTKNIPNKRKQRDGPDEPPRVHQPSVTTIDMLAIVRHLLIPCFCWRLGEKKKKISNSMSRHS